jgi:hypothetical protein
MFKIGKLFHLTHVVSDLAAVDKWYDDVFGVTRFYRGYEKMAGRDASLIAIGEVIMEPMMPARVANLQNPSVKKFHDRFGQHFHSIAWYVDERRRDFGATRQARPAAVQHHRQNREAR